MAAEIQELIEYYYQRKLEGMDVTTIRKELEAKQVPDEQIRYIIIKIDERLFSSELNGITQKRQKEFLTIGYILLGIGLLFLLLKYTGIMNLHGYYILIYGPIIAGVLILLKGRKIGAHDSPDRHDKRIRFR